MTDNIPIPAAVKAADINLWKCATKALQLQSVKPEIAYWCNYWVVNQILNRGLHKENDEMMTYTMDLMGKLEQAKAEHPNEDAYTDDEVGQLVVDRFAQETLDRAERVVKANKVTQQTAMTFDAAATFFHLVNIWGPPDEETQQKIKYAKWNAARIAKAIKEGRDPNESNPKREEPQLPALDPSDPEVQTLTGSVEKTSPPPPLSVTVEEVPDRDLQRTDAAGVSLPISPASAGPSPISEAELKLPGVPSGLAEPAPSTVSLDLDTPVSAPTHDPVNYRPEPDLPSAPSALSSYSDRDISMPDAGTAAWTPDADRQPLAPPVVPPTFAPSAPSTAAVVSPPVNQPTDFSFQNPAPPVAQAPAVHSLQPVPPPLVVSAATYASSQVSGGFTTDEAAMASAQKHAKWAISALNFEDVPTAVKELRKALEVLGAA
ncbi:Vta1 like domain-containing protein [Neurospora intermedia]|uniref:Vta1 like domain-containing protein n=1 Tax=Neurospora intermedia TaxID=5142 RepID=A0ABR3DQZ8_NEUIN